MNTPNPSEPRPPETPSASPSSEPAMAAGAVHETLSRKPPAARDWSSLPDLRESHLRRPPRRRLLLPLVLFVATCFSTLWVGSAGWRPQSYSINDIPGVIAVNWQNGLLYMGAVLAILLTHEMGHFLQ